MIELIALGRHATFVETRLAWLVLMIRLLETQMI